MSTKAERPKRSRDWLPPKDHLAAIGAVVTIWSGIESTMELTILALYEIDLQRGLVLTSNLSVHARLSLLRILAGEGVPALMDTTLAEEMNAIIARIDSAFGDRNTIVHGLWGKSTKPGIVRRLSVRARGKKLQTPSTDYSAADLWAIADRLGDLLRDFTQLGDRLGLEARLTRAPRHSSTSK